MNKSTSTRLGQILLDKGLVTAEQLEIAIKEQQKRRQLLDPFDENLGVNSSLGEILIELGFIDRLQLRRGLNWQSMLRKMAIVMSFCAPLMTVSYGAAAGTNARPAFTTDASSSSVAPKSNPGFTKISSSTSSLASSSRSSSVRSSSSSSSVASFAVSSSSTVSGLDTTAPKFAEKITLVAALSDKVYLSWGPASDNVGVVNYRIYRDQILIDTINANENTYMDFTVAPNKTYLYGVSAGDAAGNWSVIKSIFVQTAEAPVDNSPKSSSSRSSVVSLGSSSASAEAVSSTSASSTPSSTASSISSAVSSVASSTTSSRSAESSTSSSSKSALSSNSSSSIAALSSSSSSSKSSVSSSSVSSVAASSSSRSSAASSSSSSADSNGSTVSGPVSFSWLAPDLRENGTALDITEIGGYEFRYRKTTDNIYTYVTINDAWKNYYNFSWLEGTYVFQIAVFDKNGLYSNFIDLVPH